MRQAVSEYLDVFRDRVTERRQDGPKTRLHLRPAARRGGEEYRLRQRKAREVFAAGNVPICPHLMFPPIADPGKPGTGSGGTGDGPAAGGVLPAGQRLRPRLDGGHVGGDQPRREAGDPCPDRPKGAGKAPAPANQAREGAMM